MTNSKADVRDAAESIIEELAQAEERAYSILAAAEDKANGVVQYAKERIARKDGPLFILRKASSDAAKELEGHLRHDCFSILVRLVALDIRVAYVDSDAEAFLPNAPANFTVPLLAPPQVGRLKQLQLLQFAAQYTKSMDDAKLTEAVRSMFEPHIENGLLPPGTEVFARRDKEGGVEVYGTLSLC